MMESTSTAMSASHRWLSRFCNESMNTEFVLLAMVTPKLLKRQRNWTCSPDRPAFLVVVGMMPTTSDLLYNPERSDDDRNTLSNCHIQKNQTFVLQYNIFAIKDNNFAQSFTCRRLQVTGQLCEHQRRILSTDGHFVIQDIKLSGNIMLCNNNNNVTGFI